MRQHPHDNPIDDPYDQGESTFIPPHFLLSHLRHAWNLHGNKPPDKHVIAVLLKDINGKQHLIGEVGDDDIKTAGTGHYRLFGTITVTGAAIAGAVYALYERKAVARLYNKGVLFFHRQHDHKAG